ncbi:hypothetical protein BC826DRAFT_1068750 [Russula brevipes]|nr:hypothetical protein BC826DRAFT_1068750 [Russula brevipes]
MFCFYGRRILTRCACQSATSIQLAGLTQCLFPSISLIGIFSFLVRIHRSRTRALTGHPIVLTMTIWLYTLLTFRGRDSQSRVTQ